MAQKRALVTGASSGIGKSIAILLAKEGYSITAVARDGDALHALLSSLPGTDHKAVAADLTREADIKRVVQVLHGAHHTICINNAGVGVYGEFQETQFEKYDHMIQLNVVSLVRLSQEFLKQATKGDALINVASMVAFTTYSKSPVYGGTKGFVLNFTQSLYLNAKSKDIYVATLCPGITRTNWHIASGGAPATQSPDAVSEDPDAVARTAWKAIQERKHPVVISGIHNIIGYYLLRLVPRVWILHFMQDVIAKNTK